MIPDNVMIGHNHPANGGGPTTLDLVDMLQNKLGSAFSFVATKKGGNKQENLALQVVLLTKDAELWDTDLQGLKDMVGEVLYTEGERVAAVTHLGQKFNGLKGSE